MLEREKFTQIFKGKNKEDFQNDDVFTYTSRNRNRVESKSEHTEIVLLDESVCLFCLQSAAAVTAFTFENGQMIKKEKLWSSFAYLLFVPKILPSR